MLWSDGIPAKEDGRLVTKPDRIAEPTAVYGTETVEPATRLAEPETPKRVIGRPFQPGNNMNPKGRPKKGETLADRLRRKDEAIAKKAIEARDKRLLRNDGIGEKAWVTYLAYNLGRPVQPYISLAGTDDPLLQMFSGAVVEGEYTVSEEPDQQT
jgi:hypothetical protein